MPGPRPGRRANAITNSPIVRSLIKPVLSIIPSSVAASSASKTDASSSSAAAGGFYIPTQPIQDVVHQDDDHVQERPTKRVKRQVTTSYTQQDLPPELEKYWAQRHRLFSKFDQGIEMDLEGWYSVTPERIAQQIAQRCECVTIVDAFCGVGGNAIQFANTCDKVIAIDNDETRLDCARKNAELYGVDHKIDFVLADFVEWAKGRIESKDVLVDVVFLSPPWGGIDYASGSSSYKLESLAPVPGQALFELSRQLTTDVAMYLPRNTDLEQVARLEPDSTIEIEEEWMSGKYKAMTVYFGDLAIQ